LREAAVAFAFDQVPCCNLRHFAALIHDGVFDDSSACLKGAEGFLVREKLCLSGVMRTLFNRCLLLISLVESFLFREYVVHVLGLHDFDAVLAGLELNVTEDGDLSLFMLNLRLLHIKLSYPLSLPQHFRL